MQYASISETTLPCLHGKSVIDFWLKEYVIRKMSPVSVQLIGKLQKRSTVHEGPPCHLYGAEYLGNWDNICLHLLYATTLCMPALLPVHLPVSICMEYGGQGNTAASICMSFMCIILLYKWKYYSDSFLFILFCSKHACVNRLNFSVCIWMLFWMTLILFNDFISFPYLYFLTGLFLYYLGMVFYSLYRIRALHFG